MGLSGSKKKDKVRRKQQKAEAAHSRQLERTMAKAEAEDARVIKLLLIGAGGSGKSTLFKQTQKIYGRGFDPSELAGYSPVVHRNTMCGMWTLVQQARALDLAETKIHSDFKEHESFFVKLTEHAVNQLDVTMENVEHIVKMWQDKGIKNTFSNHRARFQIPDSAAYFFDSAMRIAAPDYFPTYEDMLRCRSRTTGVVETRFTMNEEKFRIMDVGGQRSERKKWIHCFEDVVAVIFVAAMNEYDQVLFEDHSQNRVVEALDLFDQTCNLDWFDHAAVILFLNKVDLFQEKIKQVDLSILFGDYTGGDDFKKASQFMLDEFLAQNRTPDVKIFAHMTTATDQKNVEFTFTAVKQILISTSLERAGLV